jgi:hypothetical protein
VRRDVLSARLFSDPIQELYERYMEMLEVPYSRELRPFEVQRMRMRKASQRPAEGRRRLLAGRP